MKKSIIILILVLIGVGGIVGVLYTQLWNPSWNPFRPIPKIVLARMALKMKGVKTFHIEGNIETEDVKKTSYEYGDEKSITYRKNEGDYKFSLDIDKNNPKNQNNQMIVEGRSWGESQRGETESSHDASGRIEFKKIGDILYFTLINTSEDKEIEGPERMIFDQWIKLNREDIGDLISLWFEEIGEGIDIKISKEKQDELIKKLIKLSIGRELFEIKEELPDEEINGQATYHYSLTLDEREIKRLISDMIFEIVDFVSESISISESISPGYFQDELILYLPVAMVEFNMELQKEISEFFEKMEGVDIEIWVGQRDNYLHRIRFEKEVDLVSYFEEELSKYSNEEVLEAERSTLIDINLSNFNEPIEIKPPKEFKDLEEVLKDVIEEREKNKRDSKRQSDIRNIYYAMKSYYNENKKYLQSVVLPSGISTKYRLTPVPEDPGKGPCLSYQWISNIGYPQQYCVWACLENGKFFAASEKETKMLDKTPTSLSECESLFSVDTAPNCEIYCNDPGSWNPPEGKICICSPM